MAPAEAPRWVGLGTELFQLALSMVLGAAIGFERELRGRSAGLRTLSLVSFGSTLIMILPSYVLYRNFPVEELHIDPGRVVAGVVMGIGFLGAGVILKLDQLVRGVTTAASIWVVAAIGLTVGARQYALAIVATAMVLCVLALLNLIERRLPVAVYRRVAIESHAGVSVDVLNRAGELVRASGGRILDVKLHEAQPSDRSEIELWIQTRRGQRGIDLVKALSSMDGVLRARWS